MIKHLIQVAVNYLYDWRKRRVDKFPRWHVCILSMSCWYDWWQFGMPLRIYYHSRPSHSKQWTLIEGRDVLKDGTWEAVKIEPRCAYKCPHDPEYTTKKTYRQGGEVTVWWCMVHAPWEAEKVEKVTQ